MWLLDWLVARVTSIQDWFGSQYWTWRNAVSNLPNLFQSVYNQIVAYYNAALQNSSVLISNFYNANIAPVLNWINAALASANQNVSNLWSSFWNWVASIPVQLENIKNDVISWAVSRYDAWINNVSVTLSNFISQTWPSLLAKLDWIFNYKTWLDNISGTLTPEWLKDIITSWSTVKSTTMMLAQNPLAFILGLIWSVALEFGAYVLGYALGTTKYELPAIPTWGGSSSGAIISLPPSAGALGKPLASLYISGYNYSDTHHGLDYGAKRGEAVYATHSGIVVVAGWSTVGYGNYIDLDGSPYWSRYAHLQSFNVTIGQHVNKGDVIGFADSTGNSTGDHLHFELKINNVYVNPMMYIS